MLDALSPPVEADPWRPIILAYTPAHGRDALRALLALDDRLANVLQTTREPALGQIRLAWWREALGKLDSAPPPAEPVLAALAEHVLPLGLRGGALADLVSGWDVLIEEEALDDAALGRFAAGRGHLFTLAGTILRAGASDPVTAAGQGWALADLARHIDNAEDRSRASGLAQEPLARATRTRWTRNGRALGAMAHVARLDLAQMVGEGERRASPGHVGRLLWHRMTGY
ncbi:MAG: squalene/phytoene synthase family protein [Sphingomonas sp.]